MADPLAQVQAAPVPVADPDRPTLLPAGGLNPVGATLGLLGDEWTLLLLRYAVEGATRYGEWLAHLPISNSVLTGRLARLTEAGLLAKVAYSDRPVRHEYRLTKRGRDVWPVLLSIWSWEYAWVEEHAETLPRMRHRRCGELFWPVLVCRACEQPVQPRDIGGGFGPSGTWERSVPEATTRRRSGAATGQQPGYFPQTMALIGNRWSTALLGAAFQGAHRFKDFAQRLSAPPAIVADRLRVFCDLGVLATSPSTDRPDWASYHLTDKGRAFFPVVIHSLDWGQRWFRSPEGPALRYEHLGCGKPLHPRLSCSACGVLLRGGEVAPVPSDLALSGPRVVPPEGSAP